MMDKSVHSTANMVDSGEVVGVEHHHQDVDTVHARHDHVQEGRTVPIGQNDRGNTSKKLEKGQNGAPIEQNDRGSTDKRKDCSDRADKIVGTRDKLL